MSTQSQQDSEKIDHDSEKLRPHSQYSRFTEQDIENIENNPNIELDKPSPEKAPESFFDVLRNAHPDLIQRFEGESKLTIKEPDLYESDNSYIDSDGFYHCGQPFQSAWAHEESCTNEYIKICKNGIPMETLTQSITMYLATGKTLQERSDSLKQDMENKKSEQQYCGKFLNILNVLLYTEDIDIDVLNIHIGKIINIIGDIFLISSVDKSTLTEYLSINDKDFSMMKNDKRFRRKVEFVNAHKSPDCPISDELSIVNITKIQNENLRAIKTTKTRTGIGTKKTLFPKYWRPSRLVRKFVNELGLTIKWSIKRFRYWHEVELPSKGVVEEYADWDLAFYRFCLMTHTEKYCGRLWTGWSPDSKNRKICEQNSIHIEETVTKFKQYHQKNLGKYVSSSWQNIFLGWVKNVLKHLKRAFHPLIENINFDKKTGNIRISHDRVMELFGMSEKGGWRRNIFDNPHISQFDSQRDYERYMSIGQCTLDFLLARDESMDIYGIFKKEPYEGKVWRLLTEVAELSLSHLDEPERFKKIRDMFNALTGFSIAERPMEGI